MEHKGENSQSTKTQSTPVLARVLETLTPGSICLLLRQPLLENVSQIFSYQHPMLGPCPASIVAFSLFEGSIDAIMRCLFLIPRNELRDWEENLEDLYVSFENERNVNLEGRGTMIQWKQDDVDTDRA
jgi:hypothetical protein